MRNQFLRNLIFPTTLLTILTGLSFAYTVYLLFTVMSKPPEFAIYPAVWSFITVFLFFLYFLDRLLVRKVSHLKISLGEFALAILTFLAISWQNSFYEVNFETDQDYILVIFDAENDSNSGFQRKGLFGKGLNVNNSNKVHLERSLASEENLRINPPSKWTGGTNFNYGSISIEGDSIPYIYLYDLSPDSGKRKAQFILHSTKHIDSLIRKELK